VGEAARGLRSTCHAGRACSQGDRSREPAQARRATRLVGSRTTHDSTRTNSDRSALSGSRGSRFRARRQARQTSTRTSSVSGVSPSGLGMTTGPPAAPSTGDSADSRIAAPLAAYSRTRHKHPRLRTKAPIGRSPRVDRCSTSPSGNRRVRIGVVRVRRGYPDRTWPYLDAHRHAQHARSPRRSP
jgi:hypothetical protein